MFSKEIVLSVGLTLCSTILIYLYVKSRVNSLENKVNSLIQIIQSHGQLSHGDSHVQMAGDRQTDYEKIVVSDDEDDSSDEESSSGEEDDEDDEEEEEPKVMMTLEPKDEESTVDIEVHEGDLAGKEILELTSPHGLHDMVEHVASSEEDGLDDMDDLDENLEEETVEDYSSMGKVELRKYCESKGFETKGKKKQELLELLNQ
jgi:hypothetical protein